jgi:hypothetical protein
MSLRELNSLYETRETLVSIGIGVVTKLAGVNASRWSIAFALSAGGGGTFKVTNQTNNTGMGTPISASGTPLVFTARDYPGYVAGNFYAVSVTAGVQVTVIETYEINSSQPTEA